MTEYRKKRQNPEELLQIQIVDYVKRFCPGVMISASMNGMYIGNNARSYAYIAKMKKLGMLIGFPDIQLFWKPKNTLFIELKIKPNKLTPEQAAVLADLTAMGFPAEVAYGFDDALALMRLHVVPMREVRLPTVKRREN